MFQYPPQPYQFGYDSNDEYGNTAYRKESGDGNGRVQGSYGYKDAQGIERTVEYVADEHGYRAQVCSAMSLYLFIENYRYWKL